MSVNNSMGGSNTEGAKYQPKFKDCKLEEKGGDKTLRRWITLIGSIVMNAPYGKFLEYFLDYALKRATKNNTTRPAFLDHDMFDLSGSTALGTSPHSKDTGHSLGVSSPRSRTSGGEIEDDFEDSQATEVEEDPQIQETGIPKDGFKPNEEKHDRNMLLARIFRMRLAASLTP